MLGSTVKIGVSLCCIALAACVKVAGEAPETALGDHLRFSGSSVQLATHSDGRHTFVTGYVGDQGPYNFIIDTGSGHNVIDTALASEMGLEKIGETEVLSGGVEPVKTDIVRVPDVRVDGMSVRDAEFIMIALGEMSLGQFHGVLGMPLFADGMLVFDPRNDRITVTGNGLQPGDPGVVPFDTSMGGIQFEANIAGQDVMMALDTGAPGGIVVPYAMRDSLPLKAEPVRGPNARLVGGERATWTAVLAGEARIGALRFSEPQIVFFDPSPPHGNIGGGILGDVVLSIDQGSRLLAMRAYDSGPQVTVSEATSGPRSLGVQFRGMGGGPLAVSNVIAGSLGERAGFKSGDVLNAVNGRATSDYDMSELRSLIQGSEPLRFDILRDGAPLTIEIR